MNTIKLNNGVEMPQQGLGTFLIPKDKIKETIGLAYQLGYRKFDTAWRYHNEKKARFVGWDIAYTPNGFDLIEMNCPAGHEGVQAFNTPIFDIIMKN